MFKLIKGYKFIKIFKESARKKIKTFLSLFKQKLFFLDKLFYIKVINYYSCLKYTSKPLVLNSDAGRD